MSTEQAGTAPDPANDDTFDDGVLYEDQVQPEYGILGFTLRELLIVCVWALAFIAALFPVVSESTSVWGQGIAWILSIGVPTAAVFLIVLRRFSPDGIRRVGSLGIDQFASVAFSVAAVVWAQVLWLAVARSIAIGGYAAGWVPAFETLAFLGLVALTVAAPFIPRLREDFHGRLETLAHRNANPVRPVIARPRPEPAVASATVGDEAAPIAAETPSGTEEGSRDLSVDADEAPDGGSDGGSAVDPDATSVIETAPASESAPASEPAPATAEGADAVEGEDAVDAAEQPAEPGVDTALTLVIDDADAHAQEHDRSERSTTDEIHEIFAFDAEPSDAADGGEPVEDRVPAAGHVSGGDTGTTRTVEETPAYSRRGRFERQAEEPADDSSEEPSGEPGPFWILAGTERDVLDEHGIPLFRIGPQAWALAIEDRGGAYVIRHDDGRIGYLHDISDITKG